MTDTDKHSIASAKETIEALQARVDELQKLLDGADERLEGIENTKPLSVELFNMRKSIMEAAWYNDNVRVAELEHELDKTIAADAILVAKRNEEIKRLNARVAECEELKQGYYNEASKGWTEVKRLNAVLGDAIECMELNGLRRSAKKYARARGKE